MTKMKEMQEKQQEFFGAMMERQMEAQSDSSAQMMAMMIGKARSSAGPKPLRGCLGI